MVRWVCRWLSYCQELLFSDLFKRFWINQKFNLNGHDRQFTLSKAFSFKSWKVNFENKFYSKLYCKYDMVELFKMNFWRRVITPWNSEGLISVNSNSTPNRPKNTRAEIRLSHQTMRFLAFSIEHIFKTENDSLSKTIFSQS